MFDLLRRLLGHPSGVRSSPQAQPSPIRTYGSLQTPKYDAGLVPLLKRDHRELSEMLLQIHEKIAAGRYNNIPEMLIRLRSRLEAHLLFENVRFYNFIEHTLRDDKENLELIRSFRREMNTIARVFIDFVRKYQNGIHGNSQIDEFSGDFTRVSALLLQRNEREELSLYPLYFDGGTVDGGVQSSGSAPSVSRIPDAPSAIELPIGPSRPIQLEDRSDEAVDVGQAFVQLESIADDIVRSSTSAAAYDFSVRDWLKRWLEVRQPALGFRKPSELIHTREGVDQVSRVLGSILSGAYQ